VAFSQVARRGQASMINLIWFMASLGGGGTSKPSRALLIGMKYLITVAYAQPSQ
jgi:hypothetical protein